MTDRALMQQALEALELEATRTPIPETAAAMAALRARLAAAEREPVALKWSPAPRKTEWGFGMVCADVEIDRDHTLTLHCEEDQTAKVDAMFSPTRSPLTDSEADALAHEMVKGDKSVQWLVRAIERKITGSNDD